MKKIIIFVFLLIISTTNFILFFKESSIENNEIQKFDDEMPFIQGIINQENINLSLTKIDTEESILEYSNWHRSHGGNWNTKYDSNNYINHNNISKLNLIWEYSSINNSNFDKIDDLENKDRKIQKNKWKQNIELNPIFINNKLIFVTADWKIVAIDLNSKKPLWQIQSVTQPSRRGILALYDEKINLEVLHIPIGVRVYKINTENGKKIKEFGEKGSVEAFSLVAPMIYNDQLVIVSPSVVLMFDSTNGTLIDRIPIHPKGTNFDGGRVWGGVALDKNKGIVFVNTGNPKPALYGVNRGGKNKRSSSVVAVDLNKCSSCHGKIRNGINIIQKGTKQIKYVPSLVGFFILPNGNKKLLQENLILKHNNLDLNNNEILKLQKLFDWWDKEIKKNNQIRIIAFDMAWSQFLTDDDLPATNPPWGYIAKLDLVSGKILWKTAVGYLKKNGEKIKIGTPIFGGLALNSSGILFVTGTDDNLAYAIDAKTDEEIWSYQMDAAGSAPPIIFNYEGKQYVSFVSTGGYYYNYKEKASSIYTFGIVE